LTTLAELLKGIDTPVWREIYEWYGEDSFWYYSPEILTMAFAGKFYP